MRWETILQILLWSHILILYILSHLNLYKQREEKRKKEKKQETPTIHRYISPSSIEFSYKFMIDSSITLIEHNFYVKNVQVLLSDISLLKSAIESSFLKFSKTLMWTLRRVFKNIVNLAIDETVFIILRVRWGIVNWLVGFNN